MLAQAGAALVGPLCLFMGIAVVVLTVRRIGRGSRSASPRTAEFTRASVDLTFDRGRVPVVGISRHQGEMRRLFGARHAAGETVVFTAVLVPDPTNESDRNAVLICPEGETPIGYLSRDAAAEYAEVTRSLVRQKAVGKCDAMLVGGSHDKPTLGVRLMLVDAEEALRRVRGTS